MNVDKPSVFSHPTDPQQALFGGYLSNGLNRGDQGPQPPRKSEYCDAMKAFYIAGYSVSGTVLGAHTGYMIWDRFSDSESNRFFSDPYTYAGTVFTSGPLLFNARVVQQTYYRDCRPPPPNPPGLLHGIKIPPTADSNRNLLHMEEPSWSRWGWAILGWVSLLAAGALMLIPFDGPAGEMAAGTASFAAFAKAGILANPG